MDGRLLVLVLLALPACQLEGSAEESPLTPKSPGDPDCLVPEVCASPATEPGATQGRPLFAVPDTGGVFCFDRSDHRDRETCTRGYRTSPFEHVCTDERPDWWLHDESSSRADDEGCCHIGCQYYDAQEGFDEGTPCSQIPGCGQDATYPLDRDPYEGDEELEGAWARFRTPAYERALENGVSVVRDLVTGLTWRAEHSPAVAPDEAEGQCEAPWRLPSVRELATIVDYTQYNELSRDEPTLPSAFYESWGDARGADAWFATASRFPGTGQRYAVSLGTGEIEPGTTTRDGTLFVLCVNGSSPLTDNAADPQGGLIQVRRPLRPCDLTGAEDCDDQVVPCETIDDCAVEGSDSGPVLASRCLPLEGRPYERVCTVNLIYDRRTNLIWEANGREPGFTDRPDWLDALSDCEALNDIAYFGRTDWRLPDIRELLTLLPTEEDPALYRRSDLLDASDDYFDPRWGGYDTVSSTTHAVWSQLAWTLDLGDRPAVRLQQKSTLSGSRCVSGTGIRFGPRGEGASRIALRGENGQYLCAGDGEGTITADRGSIGPWETFELVDLGSGQVALQAHNGQYLCAESGGGDEVVANRGSVGPWESFRLVDLGSGQVALRTDNGQYLSLQGELVLANSDVIGSSETFQLIYLDPR